MKVVVALDQTNSSHAVQSLLSQNWCAHDEVKVVTVLDPFDSAEMQEKNRAESLKLVEGVSKEIDSAFADLHVTSAVLFGCPREKLVELCESWDADMLVIGAHKTITSDRLLLGKVSDALLKAAPCTVRVVKDNDLSNGGAYRKVLIAVDQSECSKRAIEDVLEQCWPEDVSFHVVTVIKDENQNDRTMCEEYAERSKKEYFEAEKDADALVRFYAEIIDATLGEGRASFEVLKGNVREEILRRAESLPVGRIVVGSHHRDVIERLLLGSVSESLALQADCSVEVVREKVAQLHAA